MNVQHSPPHGSKTCHDSDETIATHSRMITPRTSSSGGSLTDLRELSRLEMQQITIRNKRKQPDDDFSTKFDRFQTEMMSILSTMAQTQTNNLNKISEDVSLIRDQITQIKTTTDQLVAEQQKFKQELKNITTFKNDTQQKLESLSADVDTLKTTAATTSTPAPACEDFMAEIYDRIQREKNIVISGVNEIDSHVPEQRRTHDKMEVSKIINQVVSNCAEPIKIIRLGKYSNNKSRPLKVCFSTSDIAKSILRNKANLKADGIKIFSDITPNQKTLLQNLREQLKRRIAEGEKNLTIKYVKGIPMITELSTKNLV